MLPAEDWCDQPRVAEGDRETTAAAMHNLHVEDGRTLRRRIGAAQDGEAAFQATEIAEGRKVGPAEMRDDQDTGFWRQPAVFGVDEAISFSERQHPAETAAERKALIVTRPVGVIRPLARFPYARVEDRELVG